MRHSAVALMIIALYIPLLLCYAEKNSDKKGQERWIDILRYGAVANRVTNCAAAINRRSMRPQLRAAGALSSLPAGRFFSGSRAAEGQCGAASGETWQCYRQLNPADARSGRGTAPTRRHRRRLEAALLGASHAKNGATSAWARSRSGRQGVLDRMDNGFHECPKFCEAFRPRTLMLFEAVENFTVRDVTLQNAALQTALHMSGLPIMIFKR